MTKSYPSPSKPRSRCARSIELALPVGVALWWITRYCQRRLSGTDQAASSEALGRLSANAPPQDEDPVDRLVWDAPVGGGAGIGTR